MSPEEKLYGPTLIDEMVATLNTARTQLNSIGGLPADLSQQAGERMQKMAEGLTAIRKMLFVKTQGGTEVVNECTAPVKFVGALVEGMAKGGRAATVDQFEPALAKAEEKVNFVVDKAKSLVIRMT